MTDLEEVPDRPEWHIVAWITMDPNTKETRDHWQAFESRPDAERRYDELVDRTDHVYAASLTRVLASTDYFP